MSGRYIYRFEIRNGNSYETTSIIAGNTVKMGRSRENDLVLLDETISRCHLTLRNAGGILTIVDEASANGVYLDGEKISHASPIQVSPNSWIGLGSNVTIRLLAYEIYRPFYQRLGLQALICQKYPVRRCLPVYLFLAIFTFLLSAVVMNWVDGKGETGQPQAVALVPTFTATPKGHFHDPLPESTMNARVIEALNPSSELLPTAVPTLTPTPMQRPMSEAFTSATVNVSSERDHASTLLHSDSPAWDPRLDALGVTLERATASGPVWRLVEATWLSERESQGKHHIYVAVLDVNGNRVAGLPIQVFWDGDAIVGTTEAKPANDFPFNFQMYAAGRAYSVRVNDGLPSDVVRGMGLGSIEARDYGIHVSFELTFQRSQ